MGGAHTIAASKKPKTCFVIAPLGEEGSETRRRSDQILEHVIRPVVKECGYEAIRADEISEPGIITSQIIEHLNDDELVLADLTGRNPNVFYELAIRHAVRKPVVQIIEAGEPIPFDVAATRTIPIDHHDLDSVRYCKEELARQIRAVEEDPGKVDSPVSIALDLQSLKRSDNPLEKSNAEILSMLQELRAIVHAWFGPRQSRPIDPSLVGTLISDLKFLGSVLESDEGPVEEQLVMAWDILRHSAEDIQKAIGAVPLAPEAAKNLSDLVRATRRRKSIKPKRVEVVVERMYQEMDRASEELARREEELRAQITEEARQEAAKAIEKADLDKDALKSLLQDVENIIDKSTERTSQLFEQQSLLAKLSEIERELRYIATECGVRLAPDTPFDTLPEELRAILPTRVKIELSRLGLSRAGAVRRDFDASQEELDRFRRDADDLLALLRITRYELATGR